MNSIERKAYEKGIQEAAKLLELKKEVIIPIPPYLDPRMVSFWEDGFKSEVRGKGGQIIGKSVGEASSEVNLIPAFLELVKKEDI